MFQSKITSFASNFRTINAFISFLISNVEKFKINHFNQNCPAMYLGFGINSYDLARLD